MCVCGHREEAGVCVCVCVCGYGEAAGVCVCVCVSVCEVMGRWQGGREGTGRRKNKYQETRCYMLSVHVVA